MLIYNSLGQVAKSPIDTIGCLRGGVHQNDVNGFQSLFFASINLIPIIVSETDEDIKLNSQVFHWPEQLQTIFDASSSKLQTGREKSEDEVKAKVKAFEEKLAGYEKEVDSFRKKEVYKSTHSYYCRIKSCFFFIVSWDNSY